MIMISSCACGKSWTCEKQGLKGVGFNLYLWKVCCQRIREPLGASESQLERLDDHNVILWQCYKDAGCNIVQGA